MFPITFSNATFCIEARHYQRSYFVDCFWLTRIFFLHLRVYGPQLSLMTSILDLKPEDLA